MSIPAHHKPIHHPQSDFLRPKFWEVSVDQRDRHYITPFQRVRSESGRSVADMAMTMGMEPGQYTNFENGFVWPRVVDILKFCKTTHSHPLDLYKLEAPDMPLPPEIRDALIAVAADPLASRKARRRTTDRLQLEGERGFAMVHEHSVELKPLLMALGVNPGVDECQVPLYIPDDFTDAIRQTMPDDEPLFISIMKHSNESTPRGFMDQCLSAYQLQLERNLIDCHATATRVTIARDRTIDMLDKSARTLFGEDGKNAAVDNMLNMIRSADDQRLLKNRILRNPAIIGDIHPSVTPRQGQVAAFFTAAHYAVEQERLSDRSNPVKRHQDAQNQMAIFNEWQSRPAIRRLIDWFENMITVKYLMGDAPKPDDKPAARVIQMPGPA